MFSFDQNDRQTYATAFNNRLIMSTLIG